MLVRGRVEDDARPVALEDLAQPLAIADVGDHGHARREAAVVDELALDLEERRLRLVDEDQPRCARPRRLAAELRADRAACAGDEHGLAAQVLGDRREVDLDGLAPEDVLDLHGPDLGGEVVVARDQLVEPRERLHGHLRVARMLDDPLANLTRGGRNRDQQLVGPVVAEDVRQLLGRPEHADAVHAEVLLARVVVDEADRGVAEGARLQHLADHELARVAGSHDDDLLAAGDKAGRARPLEDRSREQARARYEREQQQPVEDRHAAREPRRVGRREEVDDEARRQRRDGHALERAPHVSRRDVAPPAVVEAEEREDDELDRDHEEDRPPADEPLVEGRDAPEGVEAKLEGEQPGDRDQHAVGGELPDPVAVHRAPHRTASSDTASLTAATTCSCTSAPIPAHIGSARFSRDARSVSGKSPSAWPSERSAGCRWSGVS